MIQDKINFNNKNNRFFKHSIRVFPDENWTQVLTKNDKELKDKNN